ncbi:replication initiator [Isoptericola sediminis]
MGRFTIYLRREIVARLGMTPESRPRGPAGLLRRGAEYQQRGRVHFHAIIRLDGPDGTSQPPPPYATVAKLTDAARAAANRVQVTVTSDATGERELAWGQRLDLSETTAFGTDAEFTKQTVVAYVAKYATKSADASGALDRALFCRPCQGRGATLLPHGTPLPCTACDGTGQARLLHPLAVARHVRQMIRTCWELGRLPEFADLKLWKWAHMLDFRGPRAWRTEQARAHAGLPESDPTTTLVVDRWDYLGAGYGPGASLPTTDVRHRKEMERQFRGLLMISPPPTVLSTEAAPVMDLLTMPQVMVRLQLGRSAVYDLIHSGQLASITLGRARRIPTQALTDFIHARLEQDAA